MDEPDRTRTLRIAEAALQVAVQNRTQARTWEALNGLAIAAACIIASADDQQEAKLFFDRALSQNMIKLGHPPLGRSAGRQERQDC